MVQSPPKHFRLTLCAWIFVDVFGLLLVQKEEDLGSWVQSQVMVQHTLTPRSGWSTVNLAFAVPPVSSCKMGMITMRS